MKSELYRVPKSLDLRVRIIGLPIDEFIPAVALAIFFFAAGSIITGFLSAIITIVVIRVLKRGQGGSWLMNVGYWYLPKWVFSFLFRKTPHSQYRQYIR